MVISGCFSESITQQQERTIDSAAVISTDFSGLKIGINPGGTYSKPVQAYLTCKTTKGWLAKWTVDGSEPTWTNGGWSYNPIIISKTCTFKWRVFDLKDHSNFSYVAEASYIINDNAYTPTPYVYNGITFKGRTSKGSGSSFNLPFEPLVITEPEVQSFECEGFFYMKGKYTGTGRGRYMTVSVKKTDSIEKTNTFMVEGPEFSKRIWLPYGKGKYEIRVYPASFEKEETIILDDEYNLEYHPAYCTNIFYVNNTLDYDGTFTFPSQYIQSDNDEIKLKAMEILTKHNALYQTDRMKAYYIMCYVIDICTYDYQSYFYRKPQNALYILHNPKSAVCEGYTSLYVALLRSIGMKAKAVCNDTHAWAKVWDKAENKWVMVDSLWNDIDYPGIYSVTYFWEADGVYNHPLEKKDRPNR